MGNLLFTLGLLSILALVMVYILSLFFPENPYLLILKEKRNVNLFLITALLSFTLGLLLRVLSPLKKIIKNRCKKCNAPIPEGDIYCLTCLKDLKYKR